MRTRATRNAKQTQKDIKFLEIRYLNGPNVWTYYPVLQAIVDIGDLEDFPSNVIPGFYERLSSWLPSIIEHRCSYEERGGFLRRVREGTWPGHILEHVTLELQTLAGIPAGFGKARETSTRGVYKVVVSAWQEDIGRRALVEARDLVLGAMEDPRDRSEPYNVRDAIARLRAMVDSLWLGPSTACIVEAAARRHLPATRLLARGNLVQLGYGARSQRIWTAETDRTAAIAESISRDKDLTKSLLRSCGVPVPEGRPVTSREDAWEAAEEIGTPVVVKPSDGNHGRGVFIELTSKEEVESAYQVALDEGSGVLVERYIRGTEHRMLVVGGNLVAASRGDSVSVTGDGKSTVAELIKSQINSDPRRGRTEDHPLNVITLDTAATMEIARRGFSSNSVPPEGLEVLIQRNGNHAFDVTDEVHPSVAAAASLAARIIGLDIAGIDLVATDISRPLAEQEAAIVEVNAGPSLLMHIKPAVGTPRPVGSAIVDHLFPNNDDGRIPVVGITGSYGKTTVGHIVAYLLALSGKHTGLASSNGYYLDRRLVHKGDHANWKSANRILINRSVEAAVFENGADSILHEGLAYDRCQVGVITNIEFSKHYPHHEIESPKQIFDIFRTQVDVVLPTGTAVLNAADETLVKMAGLCDGDVIYFSSDPHLPIIAEHRLRNTGKESSPCNRAVILRAGEIFLATGDSEFALVNLADIPWIKSQLAIHAIENILAAVSAAWAVGITPALIQRGIRTFPGIDRSAIGDLHQPPSGTEPEALGEKH
jgi:cyanophycin synthetase